MQVNKPKVYLQNVLIRLADLIFLVLIAPVLLLVILAQIICRWLKVL